MHTVYDHDQQSRARPTTNLPPLLARFHGTLFNQSSGDAPTTSRQERRVGVHADCHVLAL